MERGPRLTVETWREQRDPLWFVRAIPARAEAVGNLIERPRQLVVLAIRHADVEGEIVNGRFVARSFRLVAG